MDSDEVEVVQDSDLIFSEIQGTSQDIPTQQNVLTLPRGLNGRRTLTMAEQEKYRSTPYAYNFEESKTLPYVDLIYLKGRNWEWQHKLVVDTVGRYLDRTIRQLNFPRKNNYAFSLDVPSSTFIYDGAWRNLTTPHEKDRMIINYVNIKNATSYDRVLKPMHEYSEYDFYLAKEHRPKIAPFPTPDEYFNASFKKVRNWSRLDPRLFFKEGMNVSQQKQRLLQAYNNTRTAYSREITFPLSTDVFLKFYREVQPNPEILFLFHHMQMHIMGFVLFYESPSGHLVLWDGFHRTMFPMILLPDPDVNRAFKIDWTLGDKEVFNYAMQRGLHLIVKKVRFAGEGIEKVQSGPVRYGAKNLVDPPSKQSVLEAKASMRDRNRTEQENTASQSEIEVEMFPTLPYGIVNGSFTVILPNRDFKSYRTNTNRFAMPLPVYPIPINECSYEILANPKFVPHKLNMGENTDTDLEEDYVKSEQSVQKWRMAYTMLEKVINTTPVMSSEGTIVPSPDKYVKKILIVERITHPCGVHKVRVKRLNLQNKGAISARSHSDPSNEYSKGWLPKAAFYEVMQISAQMKLYIDEKFKIFYKNFGARLPRNLKEVGLAPSQHKGLVQNSNTAKINAIQLAEEDVFPCAQNQPHVLEVIRIPRRNVPQRAAGEGVRFVTRPPANSPPTYSVQNVTGRKTNEPETARVPSNDMPGPSRARPVADTPVRRFGSSENLYADDEEIEIVDWIPASQEKRVIRPETASRGGHVSTSSRQGPPHQQIAQQSSQDGQQQQIARPNEQQQQIVRQIRQQQVVNQNGQIIRRQVIQRNRQIVAGPSRQDMQPTIRIVTEQGQIIQQNVPRYMPAVRGQRGGISQGVGRRAPVGGIRNERRELTFYDSMPNLTAEVPIPQRPPLQGPVRSEVLRPGMNPNVSPYKSSPVVTPMAAVKSASKAVKPTEAKTADQIRAEFYRKAQDPVPSPRPVSVARPVVKRGAKRGVSASPNRAPVAGVNKTPILNDQASTSRKLQEEIRLPSKGIQRGVRRENSVVHEVASDTKNPPKRVTFVAPKPPPPPPQPEKKPYFGKKRGRPRKEDQKPEILAIDKEATIYSNPQTKSRRCGKEVEEISLEVVRRKRNRTNPIKTKKLSISYFARLTDEGKRIEERLKEERKLMRRRKPTVPESVKEVPLANKDQKVPSIKKGERQQKELATEVETVEEAVSETPRIVIKRKAVPHSRGKNGALEKKKVIAYLQLEAPDLIEADYRIPEDQVHALAKQCIDENLLEKAIRGAQIKTKKPMTNMFNIKHFGFATRKVISPNKPENKKRKMTRTIGLKRKSVKKLKDQLREAKKKRLADLRQTVVECGVHKETHLKAALRLLADKKIIDIAPNYTHQSYRAEKKYISITAIPDWQKIIDINDDEYVDNLAEEQFSDRRPFVIIYQYVDTVNDILFKHDPSLFARVFNINLSLYCHARQSFYLPRPEKLPQFYLSLTVPQFQKCLQHAVRSKEKLWRFMNFFTRQHMIEKLNKTEKKDLHNISKNPAAKNLVIEVVDVKTEHHLSLFFESWANSIPQEMPDDFFDSSMSFAEISEKTTKVSTKLLPITGTQNELISYFKTQKERLQNGGLPCDPYLLESTKPKPQLCDQEKEDNLRRLAIKEKEKYKTGKCATKQIEFAIKIPSIKAAPQPWEKNFDMPKKMPLVLRKYSLQRRYWESLLTGRTMKHPLPFYKEAIIKMMRRTLQTKPFISCSKSRKNIQITLKIKNGLLKKMRKQQEFIKNRKPVIAKMMQEIRAKLSPAESPSISLKTPEKIPEKTLKRKLGKSPVKSLKKTQEKPLEKSSVEIPIQYKTKTEKMTAQIAILMKKFASLSHYYAEPINMKQIFTDSEEVKKLVDSIEEESDDGIYGIPIAKLSDRLLMQELFKLLSKTSRKLTSKKKAGKKPTAQKVKRSLNDIGKAHREELKRKKNTKHEDLIAEKVAEVLTVVMADKEMIMKDKQAPKDTLTPEMEVVSLKENVSKTPMAPKETKAIAQMDEVHSAFEGCFYDYSKVSKNTETNTPEEQRQQEDLKPVALSYEQNKIYSEITKEKEQYLISKKTNCPINCIPIELSVAEKTNEISKLLSSSGLLEASCSKEYIFGQKPTIQETKDRAEVEFVSHYTEQSLNDYYKIPEPIPNVDLRVIEVEDININEPSDGPYSQKRSAAIVWKCIDSDSEESDYEAEKTNHFEKIPGREQEEEQTVEQSEKLVSNLIEKRAKEEFEVMTIVKEIVKEQAMSLAESERIEQVEINIVEKRAEEEQEAITIVKEIVKEKVELNTIATRTEQVEINIIEKRTGEEFEVMSIGKEIVKERVKMNVIEPTTEEVEMSIIEKRTEEEQEVMIIAKANVEKQVAMSLIETRVEQVETNIIEKRAEEECENEEEESETETEEEEEEIKKIVLPESFKETQFIEEPPCIDDDSDPGRMYYRNKMHPFEAMMPMEKYPHVSGDAMRCIGHLSSPEFLITPKFALYAYQRVVRRTKSSLQFTEESINQQIDQLRTELAEQPNEFIGNMDLLFMEIQKRVEQYQAALQTGGAQEQQSNESMQSSSNMNEASGGQRKRAPAPPELFKMLMMERPVANAPQSQEAIQRWIISREELNQEEPIQLDLNYTRIFELYDTYSREMPNFGLFEEQITNYFSNEHQAELDISGQIGEIPGQTLVEKYPDAMPESFEAFSNSMKLLAGNDRFNLLPPATIVHMWKQLMLLENYDHEIYSLYLSVYYVDMQKFRDALKSVLKNACAILEVPADKKLERAPSTWSYKAVISELVYQIGGTIVYAHSPESHFHSDELAAFYNVEDPVTPITEVKTLREQIITLLKTIPDTVYEEGQSEIGSRNGLVFIYSVNEKSLNDRQEEIDESLPYFGCSIEKLIGSHVLVAVRGALLHENKYAPYVKFGPLRPFVSDPFRAFPLDAQLNGRSCGVKWYNNYKEPCDFLCYYGLHNVEDRSYYATYISSPLVWKDVPGHKEMIEEFGPSLYDNGENFTTLTWKEMLATEDDQTAQENQAVDDEEASILPQTSKAEIIKKKKKRISKFPDEPEHKKMRPLSIRKLPQTSEFDPSGKDLTHNFNQRAKESTTLFGTSSRTIEWLKQDIETINSILKNKASKMRQPTKDILKAMRYYQTLMISQAAFHLARIVHDSSPPSLLIGQLMDALPMDIPIGHNISNLYNATTSLFNKHHFEKVAEFLRQNQTVGEALAIDDIDTYAKASIHEIIAKTCMLNNEFLNVLGPDAAKPLWKFEPRFDEIDHSDPSSETYFEVTELVLPEPTEEDRAFWKMANEGNYNQMIRFVAERVIRKSAELRETLLNPEQLENYVKQIEKDIGNTSYLHTNQFNMEIRHVEQFNSNVYAAITEMIVRTTVKFRHHQKLLEKVCSNNIELLNELWEELDHFYVAPEVRSQVFLDTKPESFGWKRIVLLPRPRTCDDTDDMSDGPGSAGATPPRWNRRARDSDESLSTTSSAEGDDDDNYRRTTKNKRTKTRPVLKLKNAAALLDDLDREESLGVIRRKKRRQPREVVLISSGNESDGDMSSSSEGSDSSSIYDTDTTNDSGFGSVGSMSDYESSNENNVEEIRQNPIIQLQEQVLMDPGSESDCSSTGRVPCLSDLDESFISVDAHSQGLKRKSLEPIPMPSKMMILEEVVTRNNEEEIKLRPIPLDAIAQPVNAEVYSVLASSYKMSTPMEKDALQELVLLSKADLESIANTSSFEKTDENAFTENDTEDAFSFVPTCKDFIEAETGTSAKRAKMLPALDFSSLKEITYPFFEEEIELTRMPSIQETAPIVSKEISPVKYEMTQPSVIAEVEESESLCTVDELIESKQITSENTLVEDGSTLLRTKLEIPLVEEAIKLTEIAEESLQIQDDTISSELIIDVVSIEPKIVTSEALTVSEIVEIQGKEVVKIFDEAKITPADALIECNNVEVAETPIAADEEEETIVTEAVKKETTIEEQESLNIQNDEIALVEKSMDVEVLAVHSPAEVPTENISQTPCANKAIIEMLQRPTLTAATAEIPAKEPTATQSCPAPMAQTKNEKILMLLRHMTQTAQPSPYQYPENPILSKEAELTLAPLVPTKEDEGGKVIVPIYRERKKEAIKHGPVVKVKEYLNAPISGKPEAIESHFFYKNRYTIVKEWPTGNMNIQKSERAARGRKAHNPPTREAKIVHRFYLAGKREMKMILRGSKLDLVEMEKVFDEQQRMIEEVRKSRGQKMLDIVEEYKQGIVQMEEVPAVSKEQAEPSPRPRSPSQPPPAEPLGPAIDPEPPRKGVLTRSARRMMNQQITRRPLRLRKTQAAEEMSGEIVSANEQSLLAQKAGQSQEIQPTPKSRRGSSKQNQTPTALSPTSLPANIYRILYGGSLPDTTQAPSDQLPRETSQPQVEQEKESQATEIPSVLPAAQVSPVASTTPQVSATIPSPIQAQLQSTRYQDTPDQALHRAQLIEQLQLLQQAQQSPAQRPQVTGVSPQHSPVQQRNGEYQRAQETIVMASYLPPQVIQAKQNEVQQSAARHPLHAPLQPILGHVPPAYVQQDYMPAEAQRDLNPSQFMPQSEPAALDLRVKTSFRKEQSPSLLLTPKRVDAVPSPQSSPQPLSETQQSSHISPATISPKIMPDLEVLKKISIRKEQQEVSQNVTNGHIPSAESLLLKALEITSPMDLLKSRQNEVLPLEKDMSSTVQVMQEESLLLMELVPVERENISPVQVEQEGSSLLIEDKVASIEKEIPVKQPDSSETPADQQKKKEPCLPPLPSHIRIKTKGYYKQYDDHKPLELRKKLESSSSDEDEEISVVASKGPIQQQIKTMEEPIPGCSKDFIQVEIPPERIASSSVINQITSPLTSEYDYEPALVIDEGVAESQPPGEMTISVKSILFRTFSEQGKTSKVLTEENKRSSSLTPKSDYWYNPGNALALLCDIGHQSDSDSNLSSASGFLSDQAQRLLSSKEAANTEIFVSKLQKMDPRTIFEHEKTSQKMLKKVQKFPLQVKVLAKNLAKKTKNVTKKQMDARQSQHANSRQKSEADLYSSFENLSFNSTDLSTSAESLIESFAEDVFDNSRIHRNSIVPKSQTQSNLLKLRSRVAKETD